MNEVPVIYYSEEHKKVEQEYHPLVTPKDLYSLDPQFLGLKLNNMMFCWRWFSRLNKDKKSFRVLTIEIS